MASSESQDTKYCTKCMKICTEPVMLRCGHSFCQVCTDYELDKGIVSGAYVCPECKVQLPEDKTPDNTTQEENKTFCTYCIRSPIPAIKFCLHCEASLCNDHLKVHSKSPDHALTEPTTTMENRKCSKHKRILDYYCYEDAVCICVYCLAEKHRFHELEPLDQAATNKKKNLKELLETLLSERDTLEKNYQSIIRTIVKIPEKASDIKEKVATLFQDIRRQLEDLEKRVLDEISRQETEIVVSANIQMQKLQLEKIQLANKVRHIEELCKETDPLTVLQCGEDKFYDKSSDQKKDDLREADKNIHIAEDLNGFAIALTLHNGLNNIVNETREAFSIPEAEDILLDLYTAANNVLVSSDLKSASWSFLSQRRKETVERFEQYQVLSTRGFSAGQHYWEVEASELEYWMMGVTYTSIDPKSPESWIGNNTKSWCFCRWDNEYSLRHDRKDVKTLSKLSCNRFGIYLDYEAGNLTFYELSDPIRHLHTFKATFTEPLHAALWVEDNGWLTIKS